MTLISYAKRDGDLSSTLDELFAEYVPSVFTAALRNKDVRINGVRTGDRRALVKAGDEIKVYCSDKKREIYSTVYEDDDVLIADKEAQVSSEGLFEFLRKKGETYFIHRLDRNTEGLIVFAKSKEYEEILLRAFREKSVRKFYEAVAVGKTAEQKAVLTAYLVKDGNNSEVRVFDTPQAGGVQIKTGYEVLKTNGKLSLLKIELFTGKTHQIRAHLAHIGHPVLGDGKYGDKAQNAAYNLKRQLLISKSLTFVSTGTHLDGKTFSSAKTNAKYLGE